MRTYRPGQRDRVLSFFRRGAGNSIRIAVHGVHPRPIGWRPIAFNSPRLTGLQLSQPLRAHAWRRFLCSFTRMRVVDQRRRDVTNPPLGKLSKLPVFRSERMFRSSSA
jgi:hypothetical protein